jgi:RNA polymerase-binding protein DksA
MAVKQAVRKKAQRKRSPRDASGVLRRPRGSKAPALRKAQPTGKGKAVAKPRRQVAKSVPVRKPKALSAEMRKFREQLLAEMARLEAELDEIERRTAHIDESDRATELSSYEDHPADLASETFEREKDLAIGESVEHLLHKVISALEKIDRGTYGLCDACGRPIKKARLKALPFATLCLDCQGRLES